MIRAWHSRFLIIRQIACCAILPVLAFLPSAFAQQQFQGTCARVRIEILQTLTTERVGFEATLEITNNEAEEAITDFSAELTFENPELSTAEESDDASNFFFVRQPTMTNINRIDGTGIISPTQTAIVRWFIIPKPDAGGTTPKGIFYRVGCKLGGKMAGVAIPQEQIYVIPDTIQVKPEPRFNITYFQPRDVQGDDPFTIEVESPIPFTLGVLVHNTGYATAKNVNIESQQPKIVENKQGLLLVAQLLGSRVNDSVRDETSLTVALGDIPPGEAKKGAWDMITSLSGEFIEFKASYTHAAELGGEETSLIESLNAHFIAAEVLNDEPGRDKILDFLADTDRDIDMIPDALYETNGNILPVNHVTNASIISPLQGREFVVQANPDTEGWGYMRLNDPGQAKYGIEEVLRSDGKLLNLHNIWTNIRYDRITNAKLTYLNILDRLEIGEYTYAITYAPPPDDIDPPVTRLRFKGEVTREGDNHYITRNTQMYFTSDDISPVSIFYKVNSGPFVPALPFDFDEPGTYEVIYYAEDLAGNVETESFARLIITGDGPGFNSIATTQEVLFLKGDVLSARRDAAQIDFDITGSPTQVDAAIDVFDGVKAFPRLAGVPLSPSPLTDPELTVFGDYVDFYKSRLNGGSWSMETSAGTPLALSGLDGTVTVDVLARSQHGTYPPEAQALTATWTVLAGSTDVSLAGLDGIPSVNTDLTLAASGAAFTQYRWTIDGDYFRAPMASGESFLLEALEPGEHTIDINTDSDGEAQSSAEHSFTFTIDPAYGSNYDSFTSIFSDLREDVGGTSQSFVWDGRNADGILQSPGWYTVRISLTNAIGQTGFITRIVRIEDLSSDTETISGKGKGPQELVTGGDYAVWQERVGFDWDILALDLTDPSGSPVALTADDRQQERPHTDGRWVVWQHFDGSNYDIAAYDMLNPANGIQLITGTTNFNETAPVVDWPWIVYQRIPVAANDQPQQLVAYNLDDGSTFDVSPSTQDQLHADIHAGRVVWQDFRDVGNGEIYMADLETGEERRLTKSVYGQFFPSIRGNTVVWQDNRNTQVDIYGYDLIAGREFAVTSTPFNEARPELVDRFVLYGEDSLGAGIANLVIHDIDSGLWVPLTRDNLFNGSAGEAGGYLVWQRSTGPADPVFEILKSPLPALQLIADNNNAVPLTQSLVDRYGDAHSLLSDWHMLADVTEVSRFTSLAPELVRETANWDDDTSTPAGTNFPLSAGDFIWIRFGDKVALELGQADSDPVNLSAGLNVLSYTGFPAEYSAYELAESLGLENVFAIRMLDPRAGLWHSIVVQSADIHGANFRIPTTAVLIIEMANQVDQWNPRTN